MFAAQEGTVSTVSRVASVTTAHDVTCSLANVNVQPAGLALRVNEKITVTTCFQVEGRAESPEPCLLLQTMKIVEKISVEKRSSCLYFLNTSAVR
ncbi:UTP--glucose-1-phosphate uridylyltransferase 3,chloroplastic [Trichinella pseudospiralis]